MRDELSVLQSAAALANQYRTMSLVAKAALSPTLTQLADEQAKIASVFARAALSPTLTQLAKEQTKIASVFAKALSPTLTQVISEQAKARSLAVSSLSVGLTSGILDALRKPLLSDSVMKYRTGNVARVENPAKQVAGSDEASAPTQGLPTFASVEDLVHASVAKLAIAVFVSYDEYRAGRAQLTSTAYRILTLIQTNAGGRRQEAARKFSISHDVLRTLGRLASNVGDLLSARKFDATMELRPHSTSEITWLEEVLQAIANQLSRCATSNAGTPDPLTLGDLPPL